VTNGGDSFGGSPPFLFLTRALTPVGSDGALANVPHDGPLPLEALRDLIAIARALYAAFGTMGPGYGAQRTKLAAIGSKLGRALEKAQKGGPGTWNHRTAWLMAEDATRELGELVDIYLPAKVLITAAGDRLLKKR
jgi:hypothetical protein